MLLPSMVVSGFAEGSFLPVHLAQNPEQSHRRSEYHIQQAIWPVAGASRFDVYLPEAFLETGPLCKSSRPQTPVCLVGPVHCVRSRWSVSGPRMQKLTGTGWAFRKHSCHTGILLQGINARLPRPDRLWMSRPCCTKLLQLQWPCAVTLSVNAKFII